MAILRFHICGALEKARALPSLKLVLISVKKKCRDAFSGLTPLNHANWDTIATFICAWSSEGKRNLSRTDFPSPRMGVRCYIRSIKEAVQRRTESTSFIIKYKTKEINMQQGGGSKEECKSETPQSSGFISACNQRAQYRRYESAINSSSLQHTHTEANNGLRAVTMLQKQNRIDVTHYIYYCRTERKLGKRWSSDGFRGWWIICVLLNLFFFTHPRSSLIISHRCPPTSVLWGPCVCEGWEEVCGAVPVCGPAVPVQQCVHADPCGAVGLQVVLPWPHTGFVQPCRRTERRPGRRRAERWDRRGRRGLRDGDDSELSRLRGQQQDGSDGCLHLRFLCHAVRVLQEQRHLH